MGHGSQPIRSSRWARQEWLLKENTDLLVRWNVRLMRTSRRYRAAISLIVYEVWLLGNLNSKKGSQSCSGQTIVPLLEHEVNKLPVLLNKQSGVENSNPLSNVSGPLTE